MILSIIIVLKHTLEIEFGAKIAFIKSSLHQTHVKAYM